MSLTTTRELLEAAIARDFEDVAAHAAYADFLMEDGDPRGEYIQLRLFLEDENRPVAQLQRARQRAGELYQRHEEEWLGDLAPFLVNPRRSIPEPVAPNIEFTYRRGWVSELHVQEVRDAFLTVMADAPQVRMLQKLTLADTRQRNGFASLDALRSSPFLGCVRVFTFGESEVYQITANAADIFGVLQVMPSLEELTLAAEQVNELRLTTHQFRSLRKLRIDLADRALVDAIAMNHTLRGLTHLHIDQGQHGLNQFRRPASEAGPYEPWALQPFQVRTLFNSLAALSHLCLRMATFDDNCCAEIIRSDLLRRLNWLDLRFGRITDVGAEMLANCPDLDHLQWLDVGGNWLTPVGIGLLTSRDVRVQYDSQRGEEMDEEQQD